MINGMPYLNIWFFEWSSLIYTINSINFYYDTMYVLISGHIYLVWLEIKPRMHASVQHEYPIQCQSKCEGLGVGDHTEWMLLGFYRQTKYTRILTT